MTDPKASGQVAATGNFLVAEGARLEGNFRCDGHARVGRGATVEGSLAVDGSLAVRENATITGAVSAASDVDWHPSASAASMTAQGAFRLGGHTLAAGLDATEGVSPWDPQDEEGSA